MYKRVLVPLDGSDTARFGLHEAISLAREQKAALRLLHVITGVPSVVELVPAEDIQRVRRALVQRDELILGDAKALATSLGVEAETSLREVRDGRVADAIVDEARE